MNHPGAEVPRCSAPAGLPGVPTIIPRPGDPKLVHQPSEFVPVDHFVAATRVYAHLMLESLGLAVGPG